MTSGVAARNELLDALQTGQFALHYEVQVDRSGHPAGAEAVIRWMHPAYQDRSPGSIIALAEDTGLFAPLGEWVLEEACAKLARWKQNPRTEHMALAINVSPLEFGENDFATRVQTTISRFDVDPSLLTMEIAETTLVRDAQQSAATMGVLRNLGVRLYRQRTFLTSAKFARRKSAPIAATPSAPCRYLTMTLIEAAIAGP